MRVEGVRLRVEGVRLRVEGVRLMVEGVRLSVPAASNLTINHRRLPNILSINNSPPQEGVLGLLFLGPTS